MKLFIEKDYEGMSKVTAERIVEVIRKKPNALLCLAAGDTPRLAYSMIGAIAAANKTDLSQCRFVSLDEWVGIPPENEGSCQYFLRSVVFGPLNISEDRIHLFNAMSDDTNRECREMDHFIRDNGGIDLIVVGIGRNGHIGFNEPGVPFENYSHVVELDEVTTSVGQKYFAEKTTLSKGITLGLQHLLDATEAILIANGAKKADVIKKSLEEQISVNMPASAIRKHNNAAVIIDEEAASLLNKRGHHETE
jgi:glucosamine-6-phosphate isomerase